MSVAEDLAAKLSQQTRIDDPFTGSASPADVEARSLAWPTRAEWSDVTHVGTLARNGRRLEEYLYVPAAGGQAQPIAIMFVEDAEAPHARLYGQHQWVEDRGPILPVDPAVKGGDGPDDVLTHYFAAIGQSDIETALTLWDEKGYIQHSNGDTYRGPERLRADFEKFFKAGPIKLGYCNRMDDGDRCAFECYMPSGRPAVAVYDRAGPDKLAAARLYL
jgi:hypothetical protein